MKAIKFEICLFNCIYIRKKSLGLLRNISVKTASCLAIFILTSLHHLSFTQFTQFLPVSRRVISKLINFTYGSNGNMLNTPNFFIFIFFFLYFWPKNSFFSYNVICMSFELCIRLPWMDKLVHLHSSD